MTTGELLAELNRRGVELRADGDRLRYQPVAAVTPDLKAALAEHKTAILATLAGRPDDRGTGGAGDDAPALFGGRLTPTPRGYLAPADLPERWREHFEERAAIREYDGNQAREHAEAAAWGETLAAIRAAETT